MYLLVLIGCILPDSHGGTAVGNPSDLAVRLAVVDGLTWEVADTTLAKAQLSDCAGAAEPIPHEPELDLLRGGLALPEGEWCGLTLGFDGHLHARGATDDGSIVDLRLALDTIELAGAFTHTPDDAAFYLELGQPGFFQPEALGATGGAEVEVGPPGGLAGELARRIVEGSSLFVDADADGRLDEGERGLGVVAASLAGEEDPGDDHPDDEDHHHG